jgi:hypothetical protein
MALASCLVLYHLQGAGLPSRVSTTLLPPPTTTTTTTHTAHMHHMLPAVQQVGITSQTSRPPAMLTAVASL